MKVLFAGNKERGVSCLITVQAKHEVVGVIGHKKTSKTNHFVDEAKKMGFEVFQPVDVNDHRFITKIKVLAPDVIILAAFGPIVKRDFISIAKYGCINLHGGKLPKYRGSSPINWALINGDKNFSLTIIQVNEGVDTGNILIEKIFPINETDTISELHKIANKNFPQLLLKVLNQIGKKTLKPKVQDMETSSYYPLRFPEDGLIFFDQLTAEEIHNRVRGLTSPYPCVLTYYNNKKIKVLKSSLTKRPFFGEAGRIYRISKKMGILVCAKDKCLWLRETVDSETGENCIDVFSRYNKLATIKEAAEKFYANPKN
jgi:methionyl-tRNA formyltransferase